MEPNIQISKLNDFTFCPYSVYLHEIYESFSENVYHSKFQKRGKIHHKAIDRGFYSSSKRYLQGLSVYCKKYGLIGKIDIYDKQEKALIDRKYKMTKVYNDYIFQLFGQYFAMLEEGYEVEKLFLHSLSNNKRHKVEKPQGEYLKMFEDLIDAIRNFHPENPDFEVNPKKCSLCIYKSLCIHAKLE